MNISDDIFFIQTRTIFDSSGGSTSLSIIVYKSERTMSNYASQWHLSSQHPCKIPMPRSNRHKTAAEDAEEFPMLEHWKAFTETKGGGGGSAAKSGGI